VPDAGTQVHVRGPRLRLQSADAARTVDLRTDGSDVDLQTSTSHLFLRSSADAAGTRHHIAMNPYPEDGDVGVGTWTPAQKLHVAGSWLRVDGAGQEQACLGGDGSVVFDGLTPTRDVKLGSFDGAVKLVQLWNVGGSFAMDLYCGNVLHPSDDALKEDVAPLARGLRTLGRLRPVRYRLRADAARREHAGFIAQEVRTVLPEAVAETTPGLALNYTRMVPLLVEALQELQAQVEALQAKVDALAPAEGAPPAPAARAAPSPAAARKRSR
jgi:hypothetical protein